MKNKVYIFCFITTLLLGCSKPETKDNYTQIETTHNNSEAQITIEKQSKPLDFIIYDPNESLINNPEFKKAISQLTENDARLLSEYFNEYQSNSVYGDVIKASRMFPISIKDAIEAEKKIIADRGGTIQEVADQQIQNLKNLQSENEKEIKRLEEKMKADRKS